MTLDVTKKPLQSLTQSRVFRVVFILAGLWAIFGIALNWLINSIHTDAIYLNAGVTHHTAAVNFIRAMIVLSVIICGIALAYFNRDKVRQLAEGRLFALVEVGGCSLIIVYTLVYQGREPSFYPLMPLIEHPEQHPVFGHRLLFLWPAMILHHLLPSWTSKFLFIASQVPVAIFTSAAVRLWSEEFVDCRLAFLGNFFLLGFLLPTITYYTFYDLGIVGFYALTLWLIIRGRYWLSIPVIAAATLNHENALLLVLVLGFVAAKHRPLKEWLTVTACALAAHLGVRYVLELWTPMGLSGLRFYSNAFWIGHLHPPLLVGTALLLFRWLCALRGWHYAPADLKRIAIYWPVLFLITIAFGQLTEIRQFDADIPLAIAFTLVWVRRALETSSAQMTLA